MTLNNRNILLCVTGSVAAIRTPRLIHSLTSLGASIRVIATQHALPFLQLEHPLPSNISIYVSDQEWTQWTKLGDPILHIDLRNWAQLLLFAPLSANTLAKLANGMADNLATCVARAWCVSKHGPFVIAPAMNTDMWLHPITAQQLETLRQWNVQVIPPIEKKLACAQVGVGAMEEPQNIATFILNQFVHTQQTSNSLTAHQPV